MYNHQKWHLLSIPSKANAFAVIAKGYKNEKRINYLLAILAGIDRRDAVIGCHWCSFETAIYRIHFRK